MKKILSITIAFSVVLPSLVLAGFTQEFTATVATQIAAKNFPNNIINYTYDGSTMRSNNDFDGGLYYRNKYDAVFLYPITPAHDIIEISISTGDINASTTFCILKYNALTKTAKWIKNIPYKTSKKTAPITCQYRLYSKNLFLFVSDGSKPNFMSKYLPN